MMFNFHEKLYMDDNGMIYPIISMFDEDGLDTDDPEEVVTVVVQYSEYAYQVICVGDIEEASSLH